MTRKELAARLNGREYGHEITREEEALAEENGLVVVFGYSDDNMELRGAWCGEVDCYDGGTAYVSKKGLFRNECDDEDCPYAQRERAKCKTIEAVWDAPGGPAWTYETDIPHDTFEIMEDGEVFCRGIVFCVWDVG